MQKVLDIRNLQKSYGNLKAVDGISFSVERGSLFAFLGLNGAGKSTTINILCTLLKKDGGSVRVAGFDLDRDPEAIRRRIGVVFQGSILDARLTVKENLTIRASFYGINGEQWKKRLDELCDRFDLAEILTRPYGKLSGGQRRRVDVARGLIHAQRTSLTLLDELEASGTFDSKDLQKLESLRGEVQKNVDMSQSIMDLIARHFPSSYRLAITQKTVRMLISNEKATVAQMVHEGLVAPDDVQSMIDDINKRYRNTTVSRILKS